MTINNYALNDALSIKLMKSNLYNERTRRKLLTYKIHRPSSQKVEKETIIGDKKVMTSLKEGLS